MLRWSRVFVGDGTRRPGAKDRAYESVKQQILTGTLPGGELVSEGEIAAALTMSRTPVREAFLRLESEGLLRLYPQRGALVVPVSPGEVRSVIEARLVLEQFAAHKVSCQSVATRAAVVGRLRERMEQQRCDGEAGSMAGFLDNDRLFHTVLLDAAGNPLLLGLYSSLRDRQVRMIGESAVRDPLRMATILDEHARIADAVEAGDVEAGLDAVRVHLLGTVSALGLAMERVEGLSGA